MSSFVVFNHPSEDPTIKFVGVRHALPVNSLLPPHIACPLEYLAPEVVAATAAALSGRISKRLDATTAQDVWSLGMVLVQVLSSTASGVSLWSLQKGCTSSFILEKYLSSPTQEWVDRSLLRLFIERNQTDCRAILSKMLQVNPENRITLSSVIKQFSNLLQNTFSTKIGLYLRTFMSPGSIRRQNSNNNNSNNSLHSVSLSIERGDGNNNIECQRGTPVGLKDQTTNADVDLKVLRQVLHVQLGIFPAILPSDRISLPNNFIIIPLINKNKSTSKETIITFWINVLSSNRNKYEKESYIRNNSYELSEHGGTSSRTHPLDGVCMAVVFLSDKSDRVLKYGKRNAFEFTLTQSNLKLGSDIEYHTLCDRLLDMFKICIIKLQIIVYTNPDLLLRDIVPRKYMKYLQGVSTVNQLICKLDSLCYNLKGRYVWSLYNTASMPAQYSNATSTLLGNTLSGITLHGHTSQGGAARDSLTNDDRSLYASSNNSEHFTSNNVITLGGISTKDTLQSFNILLLRFGFSSANFTG